MEFPIGFVFVIAQQRRLRRGPPKWGKVGVGLRRAMKRRGRDYGLRHHGRGGIIPGSLLARGVAASFPAGGRRRRAGGLRHTVGGMRRRDHGLRLHGLRGTVPGGLLGRRAAASFPAGGRRWRFDSGLAFGVSAGAVSHVIVLFFFCGACSHRGGTMEVNRRRMLCRGRRSVLCKRGVHCGVQ